MEWVAVMAALAIAAAVPVWLERRREPVGEAARRGAAGGFVALSEGVVHYRWFGPEGGRPVVMVHGLTTASYVFDALAAELAVRGFRILTYDLYGRGLSDRPLRKHTRSFYVIQLRELLDALAVRGAITLCGYSMGGSIATVFAAEEPGRVGRLVLLAPAGLEHRPTPFFEFCRRVPVLGDGLHQVAGGLMLRRGLVPARPPAPDITAQQAAETRTRGYLRSVLSARRWTLAERLDEEHAALAAAGVPVLAVWGEHDRVIPLTAVGDLARVNRGARQVTVPFAGHGLPNSHAREVAAAVAAFVEET